MWVFFLFFSGRSDQGLCYFFLGHGSRLGLYNRRGFIATHGGSRRKLRWV